MRHVHKSVLIGLASIVSGMGGCCRLDPSPEQVALWVKEELPVGSSEEDVTTFSTRHSFTYERQSSNHAQAYKALKGCDWQKPVALVEVTYGADGRVVSAKARAFSVGLP